MSNLYAMLCCYQQEACPCLNVNRGGVDGRAREGEEREWKERMEGKLQLGCKINLINNKRTMVKRQTGYNLLQLQ